MRWPPSGPSTARGFTCDDPAALVAPPADGEGIGLHARAAVLVQGDGSAGGNRAAPRRADHGRAAPGRHATGVPAGGPGWPPVRLRRPPSADRAAVTAAGQAAGPDGPVNLRSDGAGEDRRTGPDAAAASQTRAPPAQALANSAAQTRLTKAPTAVPRSAEAQPGRADPLRLDPVRPGLLRFGPLTVDPVTVDSLRPGQSRADLPALDPPPLDPPRPGRLRLDRLRPDSPNRSVERRSDEGRPTEARSGAPRPVDGRSADGRSVEAPPTEALPRSRPPSRARRSIGTPPFRSPAHGRARTRALSRVAAAAGQPGDDEPDRAGTPVSGAGHSAGRDRRPKAVDEPSAEDVEQPTVAVPAVVGARPRPIRGPRRPPRRSAVRARRSRPPIRRRAGR